MGLPLVDAGEAASVSAFVKHAVAVALSDAAGRREMLDGGLRQTGGPLTAKERTWADSVLSSHDPGGLFALERNDRRVLALLARAKELGISITIPATALGQVVRIPSRQARLSRLIRQASTDLAALDGPDATAVGLLLARTGTADIVDAHVALCAQRTGQAVLTSDADDLRRISPELRVVIV